MGTHAYHGENIQFAILMDENPWKVLCNDKTFWVWWEREDVKDGFEPNEHWQPLSVYGEKLEKLFREADPWHWRKDTAVFEDEEIQVPRDGPSLNFNWKNGKRFKEVSYWCYAYPEYKTFPEMEKLEGLIE